MSEPKRNAPPSANDPSAKARRRPAGTWIIGAVILLLLASVAAFGLREFGVIRFPWDPLPTTSSNVGGSIKQGTPGMTHEELVAAMQAEADKAYIRIKINARPVFKKGDAEGNLYIVNSVENDYNMKVEIRLDDTDELIYESGLLEPNSYIDNDKLLKVLPKGKYAATADILIYDLEDVENRLGRSTASLIITVEN